MFIIKYLKSIAYILGSILLFSILIGTFSYFNLLSNNVIKVFELIAIIISMFIGGLYLGRLSNKKGFLEGTKIGIVVIVILFLLSYLGFDMSFSLNTFIFYLLILISSILGSIIGINKKSSN